MTTKQDCTERLRDRASDKPLLDVVELGDLCLNAFPWPDEEDTKRYPLMLAYSSESQLVQLRHSVDPELMFRNYWYNSGTNESMATHLGNIVSEAISNVKLSPGDYVVDIGCNDGTLLKNYPDWVRKVGYDPAKDLDPKCDLFINDFFSPGPYAGNKKAKVVTSIAMFYDVEEPVKFAQGVREILDDEGIWIIEMHYLPTMLAKNEVDAICHEHICYYSLTSLSFVLAQAGMSVVEVSFNDVNGGSMRCIVKKSGRASAPSPRMQNTLMQEARVPLKNQLYDFASRIHANRTRLLEMLVGLAEDGKKVYGYGASTKGNTLLQFCGITKDLIPAIADRNPQKHGRVTVGSRIPIISEEQMREHQPDYLFVLPYHFMENFKRREPGASWIIPVPEPAFVA